MNETKTEYKTNPQSDSKVYDLEHLVESAKKLELKLEDMRKELEGTYKLIGLLYVKNRSKT